MHVFENIDLGIKIDFTPIKLSVYLIIAIVILIGVPGELATFLKAANKPWWGIGYLLGLILLTPFAYIVVQMVSNSVNVSLPENAISIVDTTSEINLVSIGVVIGFVTLVIIIIYKLIEKAYSY